MKRFQRSRVLSIALIAAYILSACSGVAVQPSSNPVGGGKGLAEEVAFTGIVESLGSSEITVSGQTVSIDTSTMVGPNIQVGDTVKVEAQVSDTGVVLALKVESFEADDAIPAASDDETSVPVISAPIEATATEAPQVTGTSDPSMAQTADDDEKEVFGTVDAISTTSVTVDGVEYSFSSFTEFSKAIQAGDTVKLHVIVNADGTFTVREMEKTAGMGSGDDNSNNNASDDDSNDDHGEDDSNNTNGTSG